MGFGNRANPVQECIDCFIKQLYNVQMEILADASAFLAVLLNEPEKMSLINITSGHDLLSPLILPYEIGNALAAMQRKGRLGKEQMSACFAQFQKIPVRLLDSNIDNALRIAVQHGIYAYDAYYLEIATRHKLQLLTLDQKMKQTGKALQIQILELPT